MTVQYIDMLQLREDVVLSSISCTIEVGYYNTSTDRHNTLVLLLV